MCIQDNLETNSQFQGYFHHVGKADLTVMGRQFFAAVQFIGNSQHAEGILFGLSCIHVQGGRLHFHGKNPHIFPGLAAHWIIENVCGEDVAHKELLLLCSGYADCLF